MATLWTKHALRSLQSSTSAQLPARYLHACNRVQKNAPKVVPGLSESEDLFGETDPSKDVFHEQAPSNSKPNAASAPTPTRQMSPELRLKRFNDLLGRARKLTKPGPLHLRKTLWLQLFSLATTQSQLERVVEMFPRWKDNHREFTTREGDMFIQRCAELRCPLLALQVFGDYSKYTMPLSLQGAQRLLYSLHRFHEIEHTITACTLYGVYRLPPINEDPLSCAILIAACLLHPNEKTQILAKALLPLLHNRLSAMRLAPPPPEPQKRGLDRPRAWFNECLRTIERKVAELRLDGTDGAWVKRWRMENING